MAEVLPGGLPGRLTAPLRNAKKFARSAALDFEDRYLVTALISLTKQKQRLYTDELREQTNGLILCSTPELLF